MRQSPFSEMAAWPSWLGAYGGAHPKKVKITCSDNVVGAGLVKHLKLKEWQARHGKSKTTHTVKATIKGERTKVTGHKKVLVRTQQYPRRYGQQVIKVWEDWKRRQCQLLLEDSSDSEYESEPAADWHEAKLGNYVQKLSLAAPSCRGHF